MEIKEKIIESHKNDKEQLEFIFSEEKQIVVTAPAGCGKTTAMISKIAWELTKNAKPDHKKILAMSFSINAATKIKDSLNEIKALSQRLEVAKMLQEKKTYQEIQHTTHASTATISRVNRCLSYGSDGYKLILERVGTKSAE